MLGYKIWWSEDMQHANQIIITMITEWTSLSHWQHWNASVNQWLQGLTLSPPIPLRLYTLPYWS